MKLQAKPSDPLIVDRWLDVAYICLWVIYGLWGITTLLVGLPTINMATSEWYQTAWSGSLGVLSWIAAVMAFLVFFKTEWLDQITKKRAEMAAVSVLCAFILIYPVLLTLRAFDGDIARVGGSAVLALSYLIFPGLRIYLLSKKIKGLKAVSDAAPRDNGDI